MTKHDSLIEAAKAAPIASVGGLTMFGYPLSDVVLVLTFIYTIFLLIDKSHTVWVRLCQFGRFLKGKSDDSIS